MGRHHPGVAGAQWLKRAQKTKRVWRPNLHKYRGKKYCTKCLRKIKNQVSGIWVRIQAANEG